MPELQKYNPFLQTAIFFRIAAIRRLETVENSRQTIALSEHCHKGTVENPSIPSRHIWMRPC